MPSRRSVPAPKSAVKKPAAPRREARPARAAAAPAPSEAAARKPGKVKLVRDGFTMPEPDFALIATLKGRALAARREARKSELLRAGLHALMALDGPALVAALGRLQPLKVGRPKKAH